MTPPDAPPAWGLGLGLATTKRPTKQAAFQVVFGVVVERDAALAGELVKWLHNGLAALFAILAGCLALGLTGASAECCHCFCDEFFFFHKIIIPQRLGMCLTRLTDGV